MDHNRDAPDRRHRRRGRRRLRRGGPRVPAQREPEGESESGLGSHGEKRHSAAGGNLRWWGARGAVRGSEIDVRSGCA